MALADVEGDGDLDLYVTNYKRYTVKDRFIPDNLRFDRVVQRDGKSYSIVHQFKDDYSLKMLQDKILMRFEHGETDDFYLNDGYGIFSPVKLPGLRFVHADKEKFPELKDWGLTVRFQDMDDDRDPDIYICNDFESPDRIWKNDGTGHFYAESNLAIRNSSWATMGIDFSDINRDGRFDFFLLDMLSRKHEMRMSQILYEAPIGNPIGEIDNRPQNSRNSLFLNRGDFTFSEIAQFSSLHASDWSWSPLFLDVDLDGYEDVIISTGHFYDALDGDVLKSSSSKVFRDLESWRKHIFDYPSLELPNVAFRNKGDLRFEDVSASWGFTEADISHGMALGDLDNDGDLDVVMNRLNAPAALYRNDSNAPRIAVRLRGDSPNTQGIGSKVRLLGGPVDQMKEVISGGSYLSGSEALVTFASWDTDREFTLEVTWRSGEVSVIEGVKGNRLYEVYESSSQAVPEPVLVEKTPMFEDVSHLISHSHHEAPYDDFARQSLLPSRLSQLGPGVAWGDVDSDGDDDLVIPSGRGGSLSLFINSGGTFTEIQGSVTGHDQTGVVIYASSSGPEILVGHSNFESSGEEVSYIQGYRVEDNTLIETDRIETNLSSVGALCMGDIDGDGDLDLFAGGRTIPGRYPEPASSLLYINEGDDFVPDVKNNSMLEELGLVTGALFSDIDTDGDADLVLAREWGPVTVLENSDGVFTDATERYGLSGYTGWWNGVATGDFNEDGRLDIVATNWGLNTKYHASREHPLTLYYDDFDKNGTLDIVEGHWDDEMGTIVPERGLSCMINGIGYVGMRIPTFKRFGHSTLEEIVGPVIHQAPVLYANSLEHTLFISNSEQFLPKYLPAEAQFSPAFSATVADMDGDGHEDLFLSQNFFAYQIETSRSDAGRGLWLRGDGSGGMTPVPGQESGVTVYGEQRGAAVADFDGDGRVDLAVSQNGAETKLYRNVNARPGVQLGTSLVVGARVRVEYADGSAGPLREIAASSGYWSQNSVSIIGAGKGAKSVVMEMPDGTKSLLAITKSEPLVIVDEEQ